MSRSRRWLCAITLFLIGIRVFAAEIATIKVLQGTVTIERSSQHLAGSLGLELLEGDQVITGTDGAVGITFEDNSLLSLGPNSQLVVDRFQFNSTTHDGEFQTSLKQGKLAVVSGKIAKHKEDAMKVRTPASIIGVRGTEFVVDVAGTK